MKTGQQNLPKTAVRLIERTVDPYWQDEVLGDLAEKYQDQIQQNSGFKAKLLLYYEALRWIRPHVFRKPQQNNFFMLSYNHIKISYRSLLRNKLFALVNILGLSIGIASVVLIGLYVNYETSYDKFFDDSDRIYRLALNRVYPNRNKQFGTSSVMLAPTLSENYPQVESATRLHRLFFNNNIEVTIEDTNESFDETKFLFADSTYFDVFSYPFLVGDPEKALTQIDGVVLTESTALKYFNTVDVLGKSINANGGALQVTGVIANIPANSHIHFDLLGSMFGLPFIQSAITNNSWVNPWVYTYVKLKPESAPTSFEALMPALVDRYGGANIAQNNGSDWKEAGHRYDYFLQNLEDIHLKSNLDVEVEPNSNIAYVYIIATIALVILIISTINFINLSIARSAERAKEVGIRKVVGSLRGALINQFLTEAIFISSISAMVSLLLVYFAIPMFNNVLGTSLDMILLTHPLAVALLIGFVILVGLLSGLYPAAVISKMKPAKVLKGSYKSSSKGVLLRNSLITLQFVISIVMIVGSIIISQQMNFMQNKDLGFEKDNVLVVKKSFQLQENYTAFKNALEANANVDLVGGSIYMPGDFHGSGVLDIVNTEVPNIRVNTVTFDDDFLQTLGFSLVEGREFDPSFNDSLNVIVNEAMVMAMGVENAVGMKVRNLPNAPNQEVPDLTIIGVVKDYNFYSLHSEISPLIIFNGNPSQFTPPTTAIKFNNTSMAANISMAERTWNEFTDETFSYSIFEEDLKGQYVADRNSATIFDVFTVIAIIMSCTGLFGLATYIINQRIKEMSIRKVLGASLPNLIKVFSKEFVLLIGIAFMVATPIAYFALENWLTNFAYHVSIGFLAFIIAGGATLLLVLITVSYQAIKVAFLNPSATLRMD